MRSVRRHPLGFWFLLVSIGFFGGSAIVAAPPVDEQFAEEKVLPILEARCFDCHSHSAEKLKAGLFLDSRSGLLAGGDSGPAVVAGDAEGSLLIEAIRYQNPDLQMPPKSKLDDAEIAILEAWVDGGAPYPVTVAPAGDVARKVFDLEQRRAEHWAWQPVEPVLPPKPADHTGWPRGAVDQFVLAKLLDAGLTPAPEVDRRSLIRRLYLVLTGLPPTYEDVTALEQNESLHAIEDLVERLLASPRYGERWARHWLDVVRYSETLGHEFDYVMPNAWRYRDYLIRAINEDVPYDLFVREHIAGDLLAEPRTDPETGVNESAAATAFYWFAQQVHSPVDVKAYQLEVIDNQIDTVSRGFQALTVSCARCHDHKFDAISTKDFYALYGVLESSRYAQLDLQSKKKIERAAEDLTTLRGRFTARVEVPDLETPVTQTSSETVLSGVDDWFLQGAALADSHVDRGDLLYASPDDEVKVATGAFRTTRKLSTRFQGTMHSKTFVIGKRYLHLRAAGKKSRANVVIENFQVIRNPIYGEVKKWINQPDFHWVTFDLDMWKGKRAYLELLDQQTPDLADPLSGNGYPADAWFDFSEVVFSDDRVPPVRDPITRKVDASGQALEVLKQINEYSVPSPVSVPGVMDSEGIDEHVFIRGGANNHGDLVGRRYLTALGGMERRIQSGSGRLEVAEMIASAENPLTARVWVNRVWHHLFGRGIVPTVDDFGVLGEEPSHSELLDWLAHWFVTEGQWSTKKLIKMLVLTSAWQQSAIAANPGYDEVDPENVWLHKWTVRRLEGEAIRDSMLAVSGGLDLDPPRGSVPVHLTAFMTGRGRPGNSGPLDGDGKRSIYLEMRRNFMPPMMLAFDTPQTAQTFGRRSRSNVPAQALILLNDPFVHQQAERFAKRMSEQPGLETVEARIGWLYQTALQRLPGPSERSFASEFITTAGEQAQAWADLCHVLFNTKEFVFVN